MANNANVISNANAITKGLLGLTVQSVCDEHKIVEVEVGFSCVMEEYIDALYTQYEIAFHKDMLFTKEELRNYLGALLLERVRRTASLKTSVRPEEAHFVPAMFSCFLQLVGKAEDQSMGILLVPKPDSSLLSFDDYAKDSKFLRSISSKLAPFENLGFSMDRGIPRPLDGDFDFMSFAIIEGEVRHMKANQPTGYAVAAAALNLIGLTTFFGTAVYRQSYGRMKDYEHHASSLAVVRTSD